MYPVTLSQAEVKRAAISAASSGANTLVAAVPGKAIRVLSFMLVAAAGVSVNFESGTTDISGVMLLAAGTPVAERVPWGVLQTAVGQALGLTLSGATQVSGMLTYQEIGG